MDFNIKNYWMHTIVVYIFIILIGGVKMSEKIYGFKEDKYKVTIGTII